MPLSDTEGRAAVLAARASVEAKTNGAISLPEPLMEGVFAEPRGAFVTINNAEPRPERLRGCIGFPLPSAPLGRAIVEAAAAAASEDPRFPPVEPRELASILLEVSILSPPTELRSLPRDRPSNVRVGVDGIIVSRSHFSGLLLPQVATEFDLDQTEFLTQGCYKAGLPGDAWSDPATKVEVFQAEIFGETSPRGEVVRLGQRS